VPILCSSLFDSNQDVRTFSAKVLGALKFVPSEDEHRLAIAVELRDFVEMEKIGAPAVDQLISWLQCSDAHMEDSAAAALGSIGDVRAIQPLVATMKKQGRVADKPWSGWRGSSSPGRIVYSPSDSAAKALSKYGHSVQTDVLPLLADKNAGICLAALQVLRAFAGAVRRQLLFPVDDNYFSLSTTITSLAN